MARHNQPLSLFMVLLCACAGQDNDPCPNAIEEEGHFNCTDILHIGNDIFQIFTTRTFRMWKYAKYCCKNIYNNSLGIDGQLAVLSDISTFDTVRNHLLNDTRYYSNTTTGYWIGCSNEDNIGQCKFTWINGTDVVNESKWITGQPNNGPCRDSSQSSSQEETKEGNASTTTEQPKDTNVYCQMWNIPDGNKHHETERFKMDDIEFSKRKKRHFICQFRDAPQLIHFLNCSLIEPPSKRKCPPDITVDDKGIMDWPSVDAGEPWVRKCPYSIGNEDMAWRMCKQTAEWGEPNTTACTPQSQANRGERLNHLANTTIPPGQAKKVAEQLTNVTSEADSFDETDLALSVNVVTNILESGINGTDIEVAEDVLLSVDNLLQVDHEVLVASQQNENTATRLIESVEKLSLIVNFVNDSIDSRNQSVTIETANIAMILSEIDSESFSGLNFQFSSGKTELSRGTEPDDVTGETESSIQLPISLLDGLEPDERSQVNRVQFVVHKLNTLFKAVDVNGTLAGFTPVIAASIGELKITNLRDLVRMQIPRNNQVIPQVVNSNLYNVSCAFWDFNLRDGAGAWSEEGCDVASIGTDGKGTESNTTVCECNHLTNFALLVNIYDNEVNETHQRALSIISYIGCGISLLALAVTLVCVIVYRKKKNKATKILMSLCSALAMALLMFLIGGLFVDLGPRIPGICATIAVLQHYFLLAVLLWMALEATYLYLKLVKVFEKYIKNFMVKFCLIGWGVPLLVVIIVLAVDVQNYGYKYNDRICWLSQYAFYGAFLVPFGVVLIFNSVIFCLVIHQICGLNSRAMTKSERFNIQAQLKAAIGLMALLGLTWTFAIFAISEASLVFMYLFAIFNSLQGLFIFVFHCALKTDIQNGWKRTFCGQEKAPYESNASNRTSSSNGIFSTAHKYQVKDTDSKTALNYDSSTTT
ncbi:adhesion G-protein coupled receptor G6-like [Ptychodera flava]|uniref:adhesion G-protein coupled receptor G6-like n=1 Tax=Ptychodera flava TaxID=63121 RepID=UPI00396A8AFF